MTSTDKTVRATHTKGPWHYERIPTEAYTDPDLVIDEDSRFWIIGRDEVLAVVAGTSDAACESDARLIAAAPRMFARIEKLAADGDAEAIAIVEAVSGSR